MVKTSIKDFPLAPKTLYPNSLKDLILGSKCTAASVCILTVTSLTIATKMIPITPPINPQSANAPGVAIASKSL